MPYIFSNSQAGKMYKKNLTFLKWIWISCIKTYYFNFECFFGIFSFFWSFLLIFYLILKFFGLFSHFDTFRFATGTLNDRLNYIEGGDQSHSEHSMTGLNYIFYKRLVLFKLHIHITYLFWYTSWYSSRISFIKILIFSKSSE